LLNYERRNHGWEFQRLVFSISGVREWRVIMEMRNILTVAYFVLAIYMFGGGVMSILEHSARV
jgi:hypothetical protein